MKTRVAIDGFRNSGSGVARGLRRSPAPVGGVAKRLLDVTIAATALLFLTPVMMMLAFAIWRHDRSAPWFSHTRIGCRGERFQVFKFRSMVANSADALAEVLRTDAEAAREWAATQKLRRDPRITPIGHILRVSSLDELPQLFNVLMGQMSIVGPRPIVADEVERYGADFDVYKSCRPGLTGLWQVSGRSDCAYTDRVQYDVDYVQNWSLFLDVLIIAKTVPAVLGRKGSY
jgi:exopolysaccharide production protein ExoY